MWEVHDQVAHFEVDTIGGGRCRYRDLWQQRQLLLVCVPPGGTDSDAWLARLAGRERELASMETALVVTNQPIPGAPSRCIVIADRWGEIQYVWAGDRPDAAWPPIDDLIAWAGHIQMRCPECEGEAR